MDVLGRESAPFSPELWRSIDVAVTESARSLLVGRRFISLHGPLGAGAGATQIDALGRREELKDGFGVMGGRQLAQIPQIYEDFMLYWRDLEAGGLPDLSAAQAAAQALALREDKMIFYGEKSLGMDGLLSVKGSIAQKLGDWKAGENAYNDVASALAALQQKGRFGRYALVISSDMWVALQRIQPGTGVLESKRIEKLLNGRVYTSPVLQPKTAMLVCTQQQYLDLAVGLDMVTAYLELVDLNHHLRVMETALLRIKAPDAIVVFK